MCSDPNEANAANEALLYNSPMLIAIGSQNPAKIEAVRLGVEGFFPSQPYALMGTAAVSGVSNQPMSLEEALTGARNRARHALSAMPKATYAIGLEGGLHTTHDLMFATAHIVVIDREGHEGVGLSLGMPLTPAMVQLIKAGHEVGHATDIAYQGTNTKHAEGFFGKLTGNRITRSQGYRDAVIVAFSHLQHQATGATASAAGISRMD